MLGLQGLDNGILSIRATLESVRPRQMTGPDRVVYNIGESSGVLRAVVLRAVMMRAVGVRAVVLRAVGIPYCIDRKN